MQPKLAYLVTEDWYFLSHRLPMARAAREAGFEVHVLTKVADGRERIEAEGFHLHPLDWSRAESSPIRLGGAVAQVRRLLREIAPAVLHNIALKPVLIGGLAAMGLRDLAVVNSINGLGTTIVAGGLAGTLKRRALELGLVHLLDRQRTLTIAQNADDCAMLRVVGVPERRLRLVAGSGIDTLNLRPTPEPPRPLTMTFVGRMLAIKGIRTLIAAHRHLRERGDPIQLLLAGTPDPGSPTAIPIREIESWAREPGIEWLGHVANIGELWARSHIAVLPSRGGEGLPLSLLEASACGRPMIATDVPGCRDVVRDGVTGLLVPLDDPAALAGAISRLAGDPNLRARMGGAARLRAETEFSATLIAAKIAALYLDLAGGKIA